MKLELVLKSDERGFQREDLRERTFLKAGGKKGSQCSDNRPGIGWSGSMLRALRPGPG